MLVVGDVHGNIDSYRFLIRNHQESIQVGDMGVGFVPVPEIQRGSHRFIRGNHDSPDLCRKHANYLGDWGYLADKNIFFVSGADSIDKMHRIPGVSWWADEELDHVTLNECMAKYLEVKPEIMITHACPDSQKNRVLNFKALPIPSKTEYFFQACWEQHKPKLWIFGHYHISQNYVEQGTQFVCLAELETMKL